MYRRKNCVIMGPTTVLHRRTPERGFAGKGVLNMQQELEMKFYSNKTPKKGFSWETPPEPVPEAEIAETVTAEVIVLGGGISGLAASARCADRGLKVVTLDKNEKMQALAGQIAAVNSRVMAEKGITIDKKQLAADWLKMSGSRVQEDLLWLFINRSAEGFHWLLDLAGDCLEVGVYEAYKGPMFSEYPGTHHIMLKKGCDKYKHWGGGLLACEILEKAFLEKGGTLLRGTAGLYLEKNEDGRVTGCVAKCADGKYRLTWARRLWSWPPATAATTGRCWRRSAPSAPGPANRSSARATPATARKWPFGPARRWTIPSGRPLFTPWASAAIRAFSST